MIRRASLRARSPSKPEPARRPPVPDGFDGFKQISVAAAEGRDLEETSFSVCVQCHSLIVYEPDWPRLPKICRRCYAD
jgi:hypothetical protein